VRVAYAAGSRPASLVEYGTAAGGEVMSWGSMFAKYGLDDFGVPGHGPHEIPGFQAFMRNVLTGRGAPGDEARVLPATEVTSGPDGEVQAGAPVTVAFTATEPGASFTCALDGAPATPCSSPYTLPAGPAGSHVLRIRAATATASEAQGARVAWTGCTQLGTAGADRLTGTSGDDVLCGRAGNDQLTGGGGDDLLLGDAGNDRLDGGTGADRLAGGDGTDTAVYASRREGVTLADDGTAGSGSALDDDGTGRRDVIATDVENLTGGRGNDLISGGPQRNTIIGGPGSDAVSGGDGDDTIRLADTSPDSVTCGAGADTVLLDPTDPDPAPDAGCESVLR
jgi:hypothetical protein